MLNNLTPIYLFLNIFKDFDECQLSPCQNNGTCLNTEGSYICNCTTGWKDQNCLNGKYIKIKYTMKKVEKKTFKMMFYYPPPPQKNKQKETKHEMKLSLL